jgi:hypothetical protein
MNRDIPYRSCARCEFIEDCPYPKTFNDEKFTPIECPHHDSVKLTKRADELIPKDWEEN